MTPFGQALDKFMREHYPHEAGWTREAITAAFHAGWSECAKFMREPKEFQPHPITVETAPAPGMWRCACGQWHPYGFTCVRIGQTTG